MADGSAAAARPTLVAPRQKKTDSLVLEAARAGGFDPDVYHIMEAMDDALIAEEVLHGAVSGAFVYSMPISGQDVSGISVVGAAHLARHYGGLKHRMIASIEKRNELFRFTSYPSEGHPMAVTCSFLPELKDDPDFYTSVIEIADIKSGNSIQVEKTEMRLEKKRNGEMYERPNFQTIAQSKSYRNGVLRLVPQDVQSRFKAQCLAQGKNKDISVSVIDEKRAGLMRYAASEGIGVDRDAVFSLSWAQLAGLGTAASENGKQAFINAARPLGILTEAEAGDDAGPTRALPKPTEKPVNTATPHDPQTGEVKEPARAAAKRTKAPDAEAQVEQRAEPEPEPERQAAPAGTTAAKSLF